MKQEYVQLRKDHASRQQDKNYISIVEARKNKVKIDWDNFKPTEPEFIGRKVFKNYPLEEIRKYIDWTPFFQTWMLFGRYPGILKDEKVGEEATKLFNDAQVMLDRIVAGRRLQCNGVIGFYPAQTNDKDDVVLYKDKNFDSQLATLHFLRQQNKKAQNLPNYCLSDFIAPRSTGRKDYIGMFCRYNRR